MDTFPTGYLPQIVLFVAAIRAFVVIDGLAFMIFRSHRDIRWNRSMKITFPEPFLLVGVTAYVWSNGAFAPMESAPALLLLLGTTLSLCGFGLFVWSFVAYRNVGTGHYVDDDHRVVQSGPYALVRHPMYCAAVFVWLGLALAATDWALLTLTFAYIVPTYYFYAKEEEAMMAEALGSTYVDYSSKVPMLFPRPLNLWE